MLPRLIALLLTLLMAAPALAVDAAALERVRQMAEAAARLAAPPGTRVVVEAGSPDPRLRLAPCQQMQPYLPPGLAMWGRTRVGLRCVDGVARWAITVPVRVKVFGSALVAAAALPAGTALTQDLLAVAEIDIAAEPGAVYPTATPLLGRVLARPVQAAQAVRQTDLKHRQWFAAGDTVQLSLAGSGFSIGAEAQALSPGLEGQDTRLRLESGRIVTARPVGERRAEMQL